MERLAQKLPQGGYKAKVDPFSVLERLGRLEDLYDALIPRGKRRPLRATSSPLLPREFLWLLV